MKRTRQMRPEETVLVQMLLQDGCSQRIQQKNDGIPVITSQHLIRQWKSAVHRIHIKFLQHRIRQIHQTVMIIRQLKPVVCIRHNSLSLIPVVFA